MNNADGREKEQVMPVFTEQIKKSVYEKFGVRLEREVEVVGTI